MLSCNWKADLKILFLCATKDFQWFLLFCCLLTPFGMIMLRNFVAITDRISLIMQVYQERFCGGKECGRGTMIEEKTSLTVYMPPWNKLTRGLMWIYVLFSESWLALLFHRHLVKGPSQPSEIWRLIWEIQWSRIDWMENEMEAMHNSRHE